MNYDSLFTKAKRSKKPLSRTAPTRMKASRAKNPTKKAGPLRKMSKMKKTSYPRVARKKARRRI